MGMTAVCPKDECNYSEPSDNHRGAGLGTCPRDGAPLRAHTAGRAKGRYMCPVSGGVVTLGLSSTVQLSQPMRLAFHPGTDYQGRRWIDNPAGLDKYTRENWARANGLVLGPGCVVSHAYRLAGPGDYGYGHADVYLEPAPDANPASWFVNDPVTYRKCAACNHRVVADATSLMAAEWTPARAYYWTGKNNRSRRTVDTNPGPHPAGTYACPQCRTSGED